MYSLEHKYNAQQIGSRTSYADSPHWGSDSTGCTYLLQCLGNSVCTVDDPCYHNVDYMDNPWYFEIDSSIVVYDDDGFQQCDISIYPDDGVTSVWKSNSGFYIILFLFIFESTTLIYRTLLEC